MFLTLFTDSRSEEADSDGRRDGTELVSESKKERSASEVKREQPSGGGSKWRNEYGLDEEEKGGRAVPGRPQTPDSARIWGGSRKKESSESGQSRRQTSADAVKVAGRVPDEVRSEDGMHRKESGEFDDQVLEVTSDMRIPPREGDEHVQPEEDQPPRHQYKYPDIPVGKLKKKSSAGGSSSISDSGPTEELFDMLDDIGQLAQRQKDLYERVTILEVSICSIEVFIKHYHLFNCRRYNTILKYCNKNIKCRYMHE